MRAKDILSNEYSRYRNVFEAPDRNQINKMQRIYSKMEQNPAVIDELWSVISRKIADDEGNIQDRIVTALQPENTEPEKDQEFADGILEGLVSAIDKTPGTNEERIAFANTLGNTSHIDTKALLQPLSGWGDWLVGTEFSKRLFTTMFNFPAFRADNKGPGEVALALLSPQITLSLTKGDIVVDGIPIEVKGGKTSSGGRLSPTDGTLGNLYKNKEFWAALVPEDEEKGRKLATINKVNANNYDAFLTKYDLTPEHSLKILTALFKHPGAQPLIKQVAAKGQDVKARDLIGIAVKNYGESQGDDHYLIIQQDIQTSMYFFIDDLDPVYNRLSFSLPLVDSDARSQGKAQIGILTRSR